MMVNANNTTRKMLITEIDDHSEERQKLDFEGSVTNSPSALRDNSPSIEGTSRNLGQATRNQTVGEEEERARDKPHRVDTLKQVLINCNYKWDNNLKNVTDSHSG